MIKIGAQYYRPPFPETHRWEEDLAEMKASGLNTLQLWVVWGWVEPQPGQFVFDDYDRLIDLAEAAGLKVVLSTIAAIHPTWIHREVPGSEMLTADGRVVVSTHRAEMHYGITPGGSISHPGVWGRMRLFLTTVVERYRSRPNLVGWDAWNELRWNVHAGGLVDYSDAAIAEFHQWLQREVGDLEALNRAWKRRYACWEDVQPGRAPDRTYTEMIAFQHFITWRSDEHARKRYEVIKSLDPERPATVHGARPTLLHGSDTFYSPEPSTALHRGNDWFLAEHTDGIGVSSFPAWQKADGEDYSMRMDFMASAAGGKLKWLSELQGGRSNVGFSMAPGVRAAAQQRWLWEGLSVGADAILFWCWRDEVFGRESAGFGMAGNDGFKEERLEAMRKTGAILAEHESLLEACHQDAPRVGIFFSPQSFYLYWAQNGDANLPQEAVCGYAVALLRQQIPYTLVEEAHLDRLQDLDILFMPRCLVLDDETAEILRSFVEKGGTLVVESETGAFTRQGFYRYPEERHLAQWTGIQEVGRRHLPPAPEGGDADEVRLDLHWGHQVLTPAATQWTTPLTSSAGAGDRETENGLTASAPLGQGRIIFLGSYFGDAYRKVFDADPEAARQFEQLLRLQVEEAGVVTPVAQVKCEPATEGAVVVRHSRSETGDSLLFVFPPSDTRRVSLQINPGSGIKASGQAVDILSQSVFPVSSAGMIEVSGSDWGFYVLHLREGRR